MSIAFFPQMVAIGLVFALSSCNDSDPQKEPQEPNIVVDLRPDRVRSAPAVVNEEGLEQPEFDETAIDAYSDAPWAPFVDSAPSYNCIPEIEKALANNIRLDHRSGSFVVDTQRFASIQPASKIIHIEGQYEHTVGHTGYFSVFYLKDSCSLISVAVSDKLGFLYLTPPVSLVDRDTALVRVKDQVVESYGWRNSETGEIAIHTKYSNQNFEPSNGREARDFCGPLPDKEQLEWVAIDTVCDTAIFPLRASGRSETLTLIKGVDAGAQAPFTRADLDMDVLRRGWKAVSPIEPSQVFVRSENWRGLEWQ
ncbi:MAG: hypothetical protein AAGI44_10490 [Pseudomonadota bacterium]